MRRVVFREEREEERYMIRSITLDLRTKFQYLKQVKPKMVP